VGLCYKGGFRSQKGDRVDLFRYLFVEVMDPSLGIVLRTIPGTESREFEQIPRGACAGMTIGVVF